MMALPISVSGTKRSYWTVGEVAQLLHVHRATVTRMFQDEPGVVKIGKTRRSGRRPHLTLRIPDAILQRELRRLSQ